MDSSHDLDTWQMHSTFWDFLFGGGSPRVQHWPLMGSPLAVASIVAIYLCFSVHLGPAFMKNRRPFPIRPLVVAYNAAMVLISAFFFSTALKLTYLRDPATTRRRLPPYNIFCQGVDPTSDSGPALYYAWFYILTKIAELLDTVFFVLLKKDGHVSFLHLLHHTLVLFTFWMGVNNGVTGQGAMFPVLNTMVHMVMYTYYGLSALPAPLRPNLWWKKHVTQMQIVQFLVLVVQGAIPLVYECGYPCVMSWVMTLASALMAALFSYFYYQNYVSRRKPD
ncbi:very long chain fatty acid elongase 1-like [Haemaphysalis longicornis]